MTLKLIIALDFDNQNQALELVDTLNPTHCALKVGHEMFTRFGPPFVKQLVARTFKVFLDLKFHDIPNTVARACKSGAELGVWMMNVHASGGYQMMHTAREALEVYGSERPILIAVTVLTSFNEDDLNSVGVNGTILEHVNQLAILAKNAGLDGVVSSAHEAKNIKQICGSSFITVTPGIRFTDEKNDDQSRIMTPKQAILAGSDFLVIGRPITQASNPLTIVNDILKDLNSLVI